MSGKLGSEGSKDFEEVAPKTDSKPSQLQHQDHDGGLRVDLVPQYLQTSHRLG